MRRTLAVSVFLLLAVFAAPLTAQPVFGNQSTVTDIATAAAPTTVLAHTTAAGLDNQIILVSVHLNIRHEFGIGVSSVTYAGQPLTLLANVVDGSADTRTLVYYRLAPTTGTNNVIVTYSNLGGGDAVEALVGAITYSDVNQAAPTANTNSGSGSPAGVIVTGTTTTDAVIDFITVREDVTPTPAASQTTVYSVSTGGSPDDLHGASSRRTGAAGNTVMLWALSKNRMWSIVGVRLQSPRADIAVTKTATDPGPDGTFAEGETLTWTIGVTNNGPSRATNVVVTDTLPSGFTVTSITPGSPTCTQAGSTVTCTYASMTNGATNTINITGTITTNTTQLVNSASATRDQTDPNAANNSATATVNVVAPTVVHMLEMEAVQDAKGKVQISWTTSFEAQNLGFNIYRNGQQLNHQLIAGSALLTRRGGLDSGRSYRWNDKVKGGELAQYTIEDVDLDGTRTLHGPVTPLLVGEVADSANTDTLADLGSTGGVFVSPRGIGAPRHATTRGNLAQQFDLASQAAVKLLVTSEGFYRVRFSDLIAAGFAPGKRLALFADGVEQPVNVTDDAIEFYGIGLDTPSAGARAYWLVNDKGANARIRKSVAKKGAFTATSTPFTVERIERRIFFTALTNNGDRENFVGRVVNGPTATQELTVEHLDRSGQPASLEVTLQGAGAGEHRVQVTVNGQNAGTVTFKDMNRRISTLSVPLSMLVDGANTIGFTALNGSTDVSVLESLRLTYSHTLVADNDALKVSAAGGTLITASGFTSAARAIDVTDPSDPIELDAENANGTVTVVAPESGTRSVLLIGESRIAAPAQIVASRPSTWNATTNAADLVIIAARSFVAAAEPLKARRDAEGIATVIVDVQDLYDEFGFGARGPNAIREFLLHTRNWSRAPRYVLLLGDASLDPRNYLGFGAFDSVPTKLVATFEMKTASDEWFVDGISGLSIGRLPARTVAQAEAMIAKLVNRNVTGTEPVRFVADPSRTFDFTGAANSVAALVPTTSPKSVAASATSAAFDSLLLTYFGHGSTDIWSAGRFRGSHATALRNTRLPIVAAMTCLNGYFHDTTFPSFAEQLLANPQGGAVAVWASSTLTAPAPQVEMTRELVRQLFAGATLGDAVRAAKAATSDQDARRSWILFGDPSMPLR